MDQKFVSIFPPDYTPAFSKSLIIIKKNSEILVVFRKQSTLVHFEIIVIERSDAYPG